MRRNTVAVIVTVGVLLAMVVVRRTGTDEPARASTPTSWWEAIAPTSTITPLERPVGYILDPLPAGLLVDGGYNNLVDQDDQASGWLDVWAAPGASRSDGRWIAMMTEPGGSLTLGSRDPTAQRVRLRDRIAIERRDPDGVRVLAIDLDGRWHAEIASTGFTDDELADLMADISVDPDVGHVIVGADAATVFDGLDVLMSARTDRGLLAYSYESSQRYAIYRPAEGDGYVSLSAGPQHPNDLLISALLTPGPVDPLADSLAPGRILAVGDRKMLVGQSGNGADARAFAIWHDGNQTVTVSGNVSLTELAAIASVTRQSTADEWVAQMTTHAPDTGDDGTTISFDPSLFTDVGRVTTTAGSTWTIRVSGGDQTQIIQIEQAATPDPYPDSDFDDGTAVSGYGDPFDPLEPLTTVLALDATVIAIVIEPVAGQPTPAAIRITVGDGVPLDIPFVPIKDSSRLGAGYAFSQVANFSAELIGPDGASLGTIAH